MRGKYIKGDVNIFTDTCKNCGFSFTYKKTNIVKGYSLQMRLHNKTCVGKPISEEEVEKILVKNINTIKTKALNTVSEAPQELRAIYNK